MVANEDYYQFKPVISSLMNILLCDLTKHKISAVEVGSNLCITESTNLPSYLYCNIDIKDLCLAYGVMFNSLQSRVLRMLLMSDKNRPFVPLLITMLEGMLRCSCLFFGPTIVRSYEFSAVRLSFRPSFRSAFSRN